MAATTGLAFGQEHSHEHMSHGGGASQKLSGLLGDCVEKGEVCLNHCLESFVAGDKSLAECARIVNELNYMCATGPRAVNFNSKRMKATLKICMEICEECEKECRKHEKKHTTCKECADACARCVDECKKALAA